MIKRFVIFDEVDRDYHAGAGEWTPDIRRAMTYTSKRAANAGLDDVDEARIMRDRLKVRPAGFAALEAARKEGTT